MVVTRNVPTLAAITDVAVCSQAPHHILVATEHGNVHLFADAETPTGIVWGCHGGPLRVGWAGTRAIAWNADPLSHQLFILDADGQVRKQHSIPPSCDLAPCNGGFFIATIQAQLAHYALARDGSCDREDRHVPAPGGYEAGSLAAANSGTVALRSGGLVQLQTKPSRAWQDVNAGGVAPALSPRGVRLATTWAHEEGSHVHSFVVSDSAVVLETPYAIRALPAVITNLEWSIDESMLLAYARAEGDVRVFFRDGWVPGLWTNSAIRPHFHPSGVISVPKSRDRLLANEPRGAASRTWSRWRETTPATFTVSGTESMRRGDKVVVFEREPRTRPTSIYEIVGGHRKDDDTRGLPHPPVICRLRLGIAPITDGLLDADAAALSAIEDSESGEIEFSAMHALMDRLLSDQPDTLEQMRMHLATSAAGDPVHDHSSAATPSMPPEAATTVELPEAKSVEKSDGLKSALANGESPTDIGTFEPLSVPMAVGASSTFDSLIGEGVSGKEQNTPSDVGVQAPVEAWRVEAQQLEHEVLAVVAEDQIAHAKGSSVSHVLLSYPPEAAEMVDQAIAALVAKGFLTRGDVRSDALYLTATGLCSSGSPRAGEVATFAESLLDWLKARATQKRGAFTHFTWEELRKAHVAKDDADFALALTTIQTVRLSGASTGSFSMGPPPWAKWNVPSDLAQLRAVQDITGLVERAERLAKPSASLGRQRVTSHSSGLRPIVSSARESITQASTPQHEEASNDIAGNELGELVDVLIVTAVKDEWDAVLAVHTEAKLGSAWEVLSGGAGSEVRYRDFVIEGGCLRIAVVQALGMGREHTVLAAAPLLERHREIRCLAMCGVCAGRRGDVALGDVIVADRAWPYDAGKLKAAVDANGARIERFQGDMDLYRIYPPEWKQRAERFHVDPASAWIKSRPRSYEEQGDWILERLKKSEDPRAHADRATKCFNWGAVLNQLWKAKLLEDGELKLTEAGNRHISRRLMLEPDGLRDAAPFKVVVGPIASGAPVVEDPTIFEQLSDTQAMRKVIGLEMETSALLMLASVGRVPHAVVMKGAMDHADSFKSDNMKPFAAMASAECLISFLRQNMPLRDAAGRSESSPPIVQALQVSRVGQHKNLRPPEASGVIPVSQAVARQQSSHAVAAVGGAAALGELTEGAELDRCVYVVGLVYDLAAFKARVGAHVERVSRRPDVMRMTNQAAIELRSRGYRPALMRGAVAESFEELVGQANDLRVFAVIATAAARTTWPQQRNRYLTGTLGERFKKRDHGITRVLTLRERLPESVAAVKTAWGQQERGAKFPPVDAETPAGDALCGLCDILAGMVHRALAGEAPIRAAVRGKIVHIYDHVTKQNYRLADAFP